VTSKAKVRISEDIEDEMKEFVNTSKYRSKREFVDKAVQEKLEREEDAMSLEERVDRIEDKLDRIS